MIRLAALALLACVAIAVGGCGDSTQSATPTSTTPWTLQEAGTQYLAMVAEGNRNVRAWKNKTLSPQNIADYAKGMVVREDKFVRQLAAGRWPANVKAEIKRLIRDWNSRRPYWADVYRAKGKDEAWAAYLRTPGWQGQEAAVADVRTALGLPPVK